MVKINDLELIEVKYYGKKEKKKMRFLCEVSVKASLWKCIWDEPWKKIGILRGERWKNTASWGNRVSIGFLLYKLYKPWVQFWKARLLAVCFLIHKLSYKGWKALHGKIAGFFFFILLSANYMLIESHAIQSPSSLFWEAHYHFHFTDEETETLKGQYIHLKLYFL